MYLFISSRSADLSARSEKMVDNGQAQEQAFLSGGLETNTAKSAIDLDQVLSGLPQKDGIPSIDEPSFTSIAETSENVTDDTRGILVQNNGETKFYPYNVMVWHEIVNDELGGLPLAVTFCPLCGSAVVYERTVDGKVYDFGVSGKLYESNLLMYDRDTHTLWSQILGEAVVGDLLGAELTVFPSQLLTFGEVKQKYPNALVLSEDTGHSRDYSTYPYGDYDSDERLVFEVSERDERFPLKEMFYIVNYADTSVAFHWMDLRSAGTAEVEVNDRTLVARFANGEAEVREKGSDEIIPGYFAMWFSWVVHHGEDGVVWSGN
jgi:hypothetical protein